MSPIKLRRRRALAGVTSLLVLAGVVIAVTRPPDSPSIAGLRSCVRAQADAARMSAPFDEGRTRVDILGDSYSVGARLATPRTESWAAVLARSLHWRLTVRGAGGTGFVNGGPCGDGRYLDRVPQVLADRPSLVIVEGGLNDVDFAPDVAAAARDVLSAFPRSVRVVVVGPAAAPAFNAEHEFDVDRALRAVTAAAGRQYVSALDWPLTYTPDRLHPDAAGARVFAARLAAELRSGTDAGPGRTPPGLQDGG